MGCVKVVVEEEEEKEEGVGDGEELGAVEEELASPAVGETSRRRKGRKGGRKSRKVQRGMKKPQFNSKYLYVVVSKRFSSSTGKT